MEATSSGEYCREAGGMNTLSETVRKKIQCGQGPNDNLASE